MNFCSNNNNNNNDDDDNNNNNNNNMIFMYGNISSEVNDASVGSGVSVQTLFITHNSSICKELNV